MRADLRALRRVERVLERCAEDVRLDRAAPCGRVHRDSRRTRLKRFTKLLNKAGGGGMGGLAACSFAARPAKRVKTSAFPNISGRRS
jgi:hypothetical protein